MMKHKKLIKWLKSLIMESACSGEVNDENITISSANLKTQPIMETNISALLEFAVPSQFGRGSETILDENVRKGKELTSEHIKVSQELRKLYWTVKEKLFPGKTLSFKFHKLAFYESGGKLTTLGIRTLI